MSDQPRPSEAERHDNLAKLVLAGIVVAVLVAFILGNTERVRVSFVFFHSRFRLIWVLLVTNLLGFAVGYLLRGRRMAGRKKKR